MDSGELPGVIIQELGVLFKDALTAAAPALRTADLDGIDRARHALSRQVLGRVVEQVIAARLAATDRAPPACPQCAGVTRCAGRARPRQLQGLVGDFTLHRPYSVCAAGHVGHAPLDAARGLEGGAVSPGLGRVLCRAGLEGSFGAAVEQVAETLGVMVPAAAVRRLTEGVGAVAEAAQQARIAPAPRGAPITPLPQAAAGPPSPLLVLERDGLLALRRDGWHEVQVGRVAPLGPALQTDPDSKRTHLALGPSRFGAGVEPMDDPRNSEAAWWRVDVAACLLGVGAWVPSCAGGHRVVVVLADGAEGIWAHAQRFLALAGVEVVEIVDIYHAYGHLWEVGHAVFGAGTPAAAAWVAPLPDRRYREGAPAVLAALAQLTPAEARPTAAGVAAAGVAAAEVAAPPLSEAAAKVVGLAVGSVTTHAARMDYPRFVARQVPVGSGAIESAGKQLVTQRATQAGRRGSVDGLQGVRSLRALHRTGEWTAVWQRHPQRRRPAVGRRPAAVAPPLATPVLLLPAPPVPLVARPAADPGRAWMPEGRHDVPPAATPPPTPLHAPGPARPAPTHPWRRACRPQARSA